MACMKYCWLAGAASLCPARASGAQPSRRRRAAPPPAAQPPLNNLTARLLRWLCSRSAITRLPFCAYVSPSSLAMGEGTSKLLLQGLADAMAAA